VGTVAVCRADCPGAGSNGGSNGVTHTTFVRHPSRKYVIIAARWSGSLCFAANASG
jgi:hypothetical protein